MTPHITWVLHNIKEYDDSKTEIKTQKLGVRSIY